MNVSESKHEVKYERFFNKTKTMCKLSAYVAFNKATNGQTDVKHDNDENVAECHCQWIVMTM